MFENVLGFLIVVALLVLAGIGVGYTFGDDARFYRDIERECIEKGYVQDKRTRIYCSVELITPKETH